MLKAFLHDFYFVSNHSILAINIVRVCVCARLCVCACVCVWWKYLEKITSLQKAVSTNHLQNKLVHVNCIFYSQWVADTIIWMYELSHVGAESKSALEPSPGQGSWGSGCFWRSPASLPVELLGADVGRLACPKPALVRFRNCSVFLPWNPKAQGSWRGLTPRAASVMEHPGHCLLFS